MRPPNAANLALLLTLSVALVTESKAQTCIECAPTGHLGVALLVRDGQIKTGVYVFESDPQGSLTVDIGQRVWAGDHFQENPVDPFFVDLPCYGEVAQANMPAGCETLPAGSQVGFNILDDVLEDGTADLDTLKYWDGTGAVHFGPVPNHEQIKIKYGFMSRYAGTSTGAIAGFNMQTVPSDGVFHRHISYFLVGEDGNSLPATQDGVQAANGIYLLKLEITSTAAGIAKSDPIWLVFRNLPLDDPEAAAKHCMALNAVAHHLANDRAPADFNFDRLVNQADAEVLTACFTGPEVPTNDPCCRDADLDGDGDIDQSDFGLLQRCFNGDRTADPDCAREGHGYPRGEPCRSSSCRTPARPRG